MDDDILSDPESDMGYLLGVYRSSIGNLEDFVVRLNEGQCVLIENNRYRSRVGFWRPGFRLTLQCQRRGLNG